MPLSPDNERNTGHTHKTHTRTHTHIFRLTWAVYWLHWDSIYPVKSNKVLWPNKSLVDAAKRFGGNRFLSWLNEHLLDAVDLFRKTEKLIRPYPNKDLRRSRILFSRWSERFGKNLKFRGSDARNKHIQFSNLLFHFVDYNGVSHNCRYNINYKL